MTSTSTQAAMPLWTRISHAFLKDARHFQVVYLSLFLVYGIFYLGWDADLLKIGVVFATCLGAQYAFVRLKKARLHSLKSALISALGLCLLLKAGSPATVAVAAVLTIASKFVIKVDGKHIFNPTNFGIIVAIMLTGDAWVSPGQWGSSAVALYFMGAAALLVLLKVGRIDTSLAFIASFFGLEFVRTVLYLGWPVDHFLHMATNGTILLFTFFMITDPMTTPNAPRARIIWAVLMGLLTFVLAHLFVVQSAAPLWALFIISPLTIAFDKVFVHRKFQWFSEARQGQGQGHGNRQGQGQGHGHCEVVGEKLTAVARGHSIQN